MTNCPIVWCSLCLLLCLWKETICIVPQLLSGSPFDRQKRPGQCQHCRNQRRVAGTDGPQPAIPLLGLGLGVLNHAGPGAFGWIAIPKVLAVQE